MEFIVSAQLFESNVTITDFVIISGVSPEKVILITFTIKISNEDRKCLCGIYVNDNKVRDYIGANQILISVFVRDKDF